MITTILTKDNFLNDVQSLFNALSNPQQEVAASVTLRNTKEQLKILTENYTNLSDNTDYQTIRELYNSTHKPAQEITASEALCDVKATLAAILKISPPFK